MELRLSETDISKILQGWADQHFPGQFNHVHLKTSYGSLDRAELSWEEPTPALLAEQAA